MAPNPLLFTPLLAATLLFAVWSIYRQLRLVALGRSGLAFRGFGPGLRQMLVFAFGQKRVLREPFGHNHLVIFWAFMVLLLVNGEFLVSGVVPALRLSLLPDWLYLPLRAATDVLSALTLLAIVAALVRRTLFPPYQGGRNLESYAILILIGVHMLAYFGVAGAEIALGEERAAAVMPVSGALAALLAGSTPSSLIAFYQASWWLHAFALLAFIGVLIPFTKHLHVITAIVNCFLHPDPQTNVQPPETFAPGLTYGTGQVDRLTSRDLFDTFACTACGRCQNACPATLTGKPLNPRQLLREIRSNLLTNGARLKRGEPASKPLIGEGEGSIPEEAVWACTSCGACMAACPVLIEHLPKIIGMRRHLVQMEAKFPDELLNLFENLEQRSNPWGIAPTERTKWCNLLGDRSFDPQRDEYLFFVGCAGAFDNRSKQVSVALATLLDRAGVRWGILGRDEPCCGDSLRRLGNEYVFDRMARQTVDLLRQRGVRKIVTACPHCFSTLKNDYRQFGMDVEVVHHSQLLAELLADGRLQLPATVDHGRLLFHDSCYLGRHNGVYDPPRQVLRRATGKSAQEIPRHGRDAFCCGAGGGRMWIEEDSAQRINSTRVQEALGEKPDTICVSCPYCMTMFEDGLKDMGAADKVRLRDLAEVVAEACR